MDCSLSSRAAWPPGRFVAGPGSNAQTTSRQRDLAPSSGLRANDWSSHLGFDLPRSPADCRSEAKSVCASAGWHTPVPGTFRPLGVHPAYAFYPALSMFHVDQPNRRYPTMTRILIVGAGFAAMHAALSAA